MSAKKHTRRGFLRTVAGGAALGGLARGLAGRSAGKSAGEGRRPNVLIVIADDVTYNELGCYGGKNVPTPRIDGFAKQGMRFRYAYVAMSMCCPCRHELYTGLYPLHNGAAWNHSVAKPGTKSLCHHLGALGYRVGLTGKSHVRPRSAYPFVNVPGFEPNCVSTTADYDCAGIKQFMTADPARPFCLAIGLVLGHVPWTVGDPGRFQLEKLQLPPVFADTPVLRSDYAKYLAEIAALDEQVGEILKVLDETGQADNTLVIFTSEQGGQWPGAKWTNWELGVHTGFLVRWPGHVKPGTETDALVQYADVVPTLIEAAGGEPGGLGLDGTSFLGVLRGTKSEHREYVYGLHNNVPEGPPYPIRTVRTKQFRYLRNLTPGAEYVEKHMEQPKLWGNWWTSWKQAARTDPHAKKMFLRYRRRPAEELYRSNTDVYELENLADRPEYAAVKARLRAELDRWMKSQNDPGAAMDTPEALAANRRAGAAGNRPRKKRP